MANGIIIDVGFKADIQKFVDDINKEFKKIDFDKQLGLSEAFEKQEKDIRRKLEELSKSIDQTINGKIGNEPIKQMDELKKSVSVLAKSFKAMQDSMSPEMANRYSQSFADVSSSVDGLVNVCKNATKAMKDVDKASNGSGIKLVDDSEKDKINSLLDEYRELNRVLQEIEKADSFMGKQDGNSKWKNEFDLADKIEEQYLEVIRAKDEYEKAYEDGDQELINSTTRTYAEMYATLERYFSSYKKLFGGTDSSKFDFGEDTLSIEAIRNKFSGDFEALIDDIKDRSDELKNVLKNTFKIDADDYFSKKNSALENVSVNDLNKISESENNAIKLTVPMDISTRSSTLYKQAIKIISDAQSKVESNPLQVEVQLVSSYRSNANQKAIKEIADGLDNIADDEIRKKMTDLIDGMQTNIDNALLFDVKINTERATTAVKEFVESARDELAMLSSNLAPLEPEIILTDENKAKFQQELNSASGSFQISVGVFDENGNVDQNATKKENAYIDLLKKKVDAVTESVNAKSLAFIDEEGVVKDSIISERDYLNGMYGDLVSIEAQIQEICSALKNIPNKVDVSIDLGESGANVLKQISGAKRSIANAVSVKASNGSANVKDLKEYADILDKIDKPELSNTLHGISDSIKELMESGNNSGDTIEALEKLKKLINSLGNDKSSDKINKIADNLKTFADSVNNLDISDNGFIDKLNAILEKGDELKALSKIVKDAKKSTSSSSDNFAVFESARNDFSSIEKQFNKAFKGNEVAVNDVYALMNKLADKWQEVQSLSSKGLISSEQLNELERYFDAISKDINTLSVADLQDKFNKGSYTDNVLNKLESVKTQYQDLNGIINKIKDNQPLDSSDLAIIKKFSFSINELNGNLAGTDEKFAKVVSSAKLLNKIEKTLGDNTAMSKELRVQFEALANELRSMGDYVPVDDFNRLTTSFIRLSTEMEVAGKKGKSFFDMFKKDVVTKSAGVLAQYFSLYDIIRYTREMAQAVVEVNSAQIELRKVSDASDNQLVKYWEHATESAKKYGAEINEVINSSADWSRLGYNIEDAEKLADATTLLQRVGDNMTQESSSEGLISVLKGFGKAAEDADHIVDVINQVANTEPIDTAGLFEGLQKSASSLNAANNTLEQSISLITTANSVVQDPSSVGVWLCRL